MSIDTTAPKPVTQMTDAEKSAHIKKVVLAAGEELRERHPWLRHQNAIGAGILAGSLLGMLAGGWLYYVGVLPAWACIPLVALFASFTHELEHDLIHLMYFRKNKWAHNLMLALAWLARPSTINPWIRRHLHLHHHKHSGTESDLEERAITNGEEWGIRRFLMTGDGFLSILLRLHRAPSAKLRLRMIVRSLVAYFPLGWFHWGLWWFFLTFHAVNGAALAAGVDLAWSAGTLAFVDFVNFMVVVLIGPNVLRSFCLHFVSSNMHYFGDIEDGNVMQQTQVFNPWWLAPFQLFCFNFGSTHAIHHFVVKEPFYVRQATAGTAHKVMREMGVRFNDTGTFKRANRFRERAQNA